MREQNKRNFKTIFPSPKVDGVYTRFNIQLICFISCYLYHSILKYAWNISMTIPFHSMKHLAYKA